MLWLLAVIKKHLETLKIPLEDMRGQGYDNGGNMKDRHKRRSKPNPRSEAESFVCAL